MRVLGLIPARGGSKSVPRKNIKPLAGKPLIAHTIEAALKSELIDKLIVSTDDEEIAEVARQYGAEVPFMRPQELADDKTLDFPVIEHAILWLDDNKWSPDIVVFLRPTNIFRTGEEIDRAIQKILTSDFDSVRGISKAAYPPYWMKRIEGDLLVPFIDTPYAETRRQELPEVFQGNGTIEVIRKHTILEKKSRFGDKVGFLIMPDIAAQDIDSELDFKISEFLYPQWKKGLLDE